MMAKEYLLASDFDQTLSFNDSGIVLSEIVGIPGFREKVAGLSRTNLVQQGGELAYLLRHDPDYRGVRREHLLEAGKRIRLKQNIQLLVRLLQEGIEGHRFAFYVISAAPEEVIQSALEDIVGMTPARIRSFFEEHGLAIQEWDRVRTDWLTIGQSASDDGAVASLATAER